MTLRSAPHDTTHLVCLGAGGVLLFPGWARVSSVLAKHGIEVAPGRLAAADAPAKWRLDRGDAFATTNNAGHGSIYLEAVLDEAGVVASQVTAAVIADLRASHAERNLWEVPGTHVAQALAQLRDMRLRLAVVSNADGRLGQLLDAADLTRWFDLVVDSHEVGFEKPDPRIFQIVLQRLDVEPGRAVHVGDLYQVDVVGARAAGLRAVLLDPASLHVDVDCPRIASLLDLPAVLSAPDEQR